MTQNTEQNVQITALSLALQEDAWMATPAGEYALEVIKEAEARGTEEQRRKGGEQGEPIGYLITEHSGDGKQSAITFTKQPVNPEDMSEFQLTSLPVYGRPANIAALEAEIASLKEAEQLARADAEASKVREANDQEVILWLAERLAVADPDLKADCDLLSRAALTREGGV